MKRQPSQTESDRLTNGEKVCLEIAEAFPEVYEIIEGRVSVKNPQTLNALKTQQDLAEMYSEADARRKKQSKKKPIGKT